MTRRKSASKYVGRSSASTIALVAGFLAGCSSEPHQRAPTENEGESCERQLAPPTSAGCQAWREATCALRPVDQRALCLTQLGAIECRSEDQAEACALAIIADSCKESYASTCAPAAIADASSAVEGCHAYTTAACESAVRCGLAPSIEDCRQRGELRCDQALGVRNELAACLSALTTVACSAWVPPPACVGVVVLLE